MPADRAAPSTLTESIRLIWKSACCRPPSPGKREALRADRVSELPSGVALTIAEDGAGW